MKKTLLVYAFILLGLYIVLSIFDYKGEYEAEKDLWKINAKFAEYTKDPKIIPTGTYEDIRKRYEHFINSHQDSKLLPLAELHIGHTYMAMKSYDKARDYFEAFIKKYKSKPILGVQAAVEITRTYALEENEAGVAKSYERVIQDFPQTDIGLKTPMLVVDFYKNTGKAARAQKALDDAELHYKNLMQKYPNSPTELKALRMLVNCYIAKGQFASAVDRLEEILMKFPDPQILTAKAMENIVKTINGICIAQLRDMDRPVKLYSKFVEKYPNHPYTPFFKTVIQKFKVLKEQKVNIFLDNKKAQQ